MQGLVKDVQKEAFYRLINETIPNTIRNTRYTIGDCELTFEPLEAGNQILLEDDRGTEYYSTKAVCFLHDTVTGEEVEFNVELLKVPVLQELGFKIKGNYLQQLDVYERAVGWNFYQDKRNGECASLITENKKSLYFNYTGHGPIVRILTHGENKKVRIGISTLFRVLAGCSNEELMSMFGYGNPYVIEAFSTRGDNSSIDNCIRLVAKAVLNNDKVENSTVLNLKKEIETNLFSETYFPLGSSNASRFNHFQSFSYRANGRILAESLECNGYSFEKGIVLSANELAILDRLPIRELCVEYNGKIYRLRKFSNFTLNALGCTIRSDVPDLGLRSGKKLEVQDIDVLNASTLSSIIVDDNKQVVRRMGAASLCVEDLFTAFSIWSDNLNGFNQHSKQFEISNRVLISYDKRVMQYVSGALQCIADNVRENLRGVEERGQLATCVNECYKGIDTNAFVDSISSASNNASQISDMCNLMAYISKSNKTTANLGGASSTEEMVNMQDLQEGRLDPLDVPESDKIGSVHYRTMLSRLDGDGCPTTPYLRVRNGEVLSDEPVYLTAVEESDLYIAEWDETFREEDGSLKQRVRTRCNGNVQSVELSRVLYKEYSPYQNLSPAHSMVPFPGHSNGKRITMACNQVKQATPLVNRERPLTMGGGESILGVGSFTAEDVLRDYYNKNKCTITENEETVMSSSIVLESIHSENGQRTLTFSVESVKSGNNEAVLKVPYAYRTFECTMFSYDVNPSPDRRYRGEDVVAYNNGYSIEEKPLVKCADFGAQKVDDRVFNKGMALTKNLNVVYKTFSGSTIDDSITISSKLVYDDSLTHIGLFEIKDICVQGKDETEAFSIQKNNAPEYLKSNGLPRVGTILKPGMVAISKVRRSANKTSMKYVYTPKYVEGQVIAADIMTTQKGLEAKVIVAQRSYAQQGDKLAGRCGNKGVIARIVPESEMPFVEETGEVADVVLNPMGVPSRQNITQLLECTLSYCMKLEDSIALVTPYNKNDIDFVRMYAAKDHAEPKIMIDGRTGTRFARPMNFGVLPMYKLHHVSKRKIHSVGMDAKLDSTFLQPTKGSKMNGGQSIGEMESWCLESVGATALLNELFTIQSDDVESRDRLIEGQQLNFTESSIDGNNSNDLAMQACYRSLGVEFSSSVEEGCYSFTPLKDDEIRSFCASPITDRSMLHAEFIFGPRNSLEEKAAGRSKWGWIDLRQKMIMPLWLYKGSIAKVLGVSMSNLRETVQCQQYLGLFPNNEVRFASKDSMETLSVDAPAIAERYKTGMEAVVELFETFDTHAAELLAKAKLEDFRARYPESKNSPTEAKLISVYRARKDFNRSGQKLTDYVVSSFPVMPQTYRPEISVAGRAVVPDFDWFYAQILHMVSELEKNNNSDTQKALFNAILEFTGLDDHFKNKKYKSILTFFCAKGQKKHHGKIRENIQSKRILCSGRCVIIAAEDVTRTPLELGVPFSMMVTMYSEQLFGYFSALSTGTAFNRKIFDKMMMNLALRDRKRFDHEFSKISAAFDFDRGSKTYDYVTELVTAFLEGRDGNPVKAVGFGRQPSLHKYSIRAFKPYVVYGNAIHIHSLVCKGFNADFDGDQGYVFAIQTQESINEALEKLSPGKDFILPKNGTVVLEHSQDIVLGVYCATMLKDNSTVFSGSLRDALYYSSIDMLKTDVQSGIVSVHDLVVYEHNSDAKYLSTAGRVIFNSLIPGAFTEQPFTNRLKIDGIKSENYRELQYDGLVGSGSGNGEMEYYNLPSICRAVYDECPDRCIGVYQDITEFGFFISDLTGVSIGIFDFDIETNKSDMISGAEKLKSLIEQDYQDGLISEQDKRNAVISIYGDKKSGVNDKILNDLLDHLPRNNNIFIMMDSGARGNKSQFMQMCGSVGVLQKTKTEDLETSVTKNYYEGLNSFDVHLASYSARTGVASTQNETKRSGYATHKVVYMASGIQVVESDCGNHKQRFDIEWDEHDDSKDRFIPTREWFEKHLLGKKVDTSYQDDKLVACDGMITEDSYEKIQLIGGFHELHTQHDCIKASIYNAVGERVLDTESKRLLKYAAKKSVLDVGSITALLRQKVGEVVTNNGTYVLRYTMSPCCKSLMQSRVAYNLPFRKEVYDPETNESLGVVTDESIRFIEDNKVDRVLMRTTMRCRSKFGICAHCYGLQFSNNLFPEVGSFVGTESAQSICEPASQLTMNVINKGGTAGSSRVSSGVQVFDDLLGGTRQDGSMTAVVAPHTGYLFAERMDSQATVCIMPDDKECSMCIKCREINKAVKCPKEDDVGGQPLCMLSTRIPFHDIIQKDGEFVKAGTPITKDMVHPDAIVSIEQPFTEEDLHVSKQRVWINNYFNTFKDSGISIYARHFELISYIQNKYVSIESSEDDSFDVGEVHEFNEVMDKSNKVRFRQFVSKRSDVVVRNSGALAALSFENVAEIAANLVLSGHKEYANRNHSLIGSLSIGENLKDRRIKVLHKMPVIHRGVAKQSEVGELVTRERFEIKKEKVEEGFSLQGIDFEALTLGITSFSKEEEQVTIVAEKEPKEHLTMDDFILGDDDDEFAYDSDGIKDNTKQTEQAVESYNTMKVTKANAF